MSYLSSKTFPTIWYFLELNKDGLNIFICTYPWMTKQSSTHTCPVVCAVLIITTTNTADWPWASGQLFADVSSSPNHMSIIFSSECPVVWRQILTEDQVSSISLSKPYHSILGRNLDCHSKVSLQFYPLPWWVMYLGNGVNRWLQHWWCTGPGRLLPSPQRPLFPSTFLSVCVLVTESCLFEHIKTFRVASYDSVLIWTSFPIPHVTHTRFHS